MYNYKLVIAFVYFLLPFRTSAQETFTVPFDTVSHITKSRYSTLKVLDMRSNKQDIGYVKTGMFSKVRKAVTEKSLDTCLSLCFEKMLSTANKDEGELMLVLYHFKIEDQPKGTSMGTFYFDGDFYGRHTGEYKFLGKVDSLYELRAAFDATSKLLNATPMKICDLLSRFAILKENDDKYFSVQEALNRRETEKQKYPIYRTKEFKKGIYYTVDQFINNQPVDTPIIKEESFSGEKKEMAYHYANKKGRKGKRVEENSFFALYDGSTWATGINGHCEAMFFEDGDFYAKKWLKGLRNNDDVLLGAGALFGVAGVLAAEAASGNDKKTGDALYRAKFDPTTKKFIPVSRLY